MRCVLPACLPAPPAVRWPLAAALPHHFSISSLHFTAVISPAGDAVAIDMPMTADAVAIYLGIVLAGCAAVSIADSFSAREIASRARISRTKAVFTQDVILRGGKALPLYIRVVEAGLPRIIVLPATPRASLQVQLRPQDVSWAAFLAAALPPSAAGELRPHVVGADDLSGVIFSSGTTGEAAAAAAQWLGCPAAACLPACPPRFAATSRPRAFNPLLQATLKPFPGRTQRRCAAPPTPFFTRTCARATWPAGPQTWAG